MKTNPHLIFLPQKAPLNTTSLITKKTVYQKNNAPDKPIFPNKAFPGFFKAN